ncbi:MAG: 4Fe-4S dicluster domain-containing protein [Deltaproteobacteria bacterium]|nr:4Fe-4S dicluster domain-containing protein [Deltaproteobacteria bacterium]
MDRKLLTIDPEKCTGCRNCELVCSVRHYGVSNPALSRIQVVKWEHIGIYIPMSCQQCEDAPCLEVCPKDAIYRDDALGSVAINPDLCIGCKMCVAACPFGAMRWNSGRSRVFKCDLCDGDPQCVRFCYTRAVDYQAAGKVSSDRLRQAAENLARATRHHQR